MVLLFSCGSSSSLFLFEEAERTMAATKYQFQLPKVEQSNNPPLYSRCTYFLSPDDVKNRMIDVCDPEETDYARKNNPQHNSELSAPDADFDIQNTTYATIKCYNFIERSVYFSLPNSGWLMRVVCSPSSAANGHPKDSIFGMW